MSQTENHKVSIIIVNFNGIKYLPECLDSISRLDYPKDLLEVVVVDNASSDGSCELIESGYPWVRLVKVSRNLGFAEGNNVGIRASGGDFLALVNNDTVVDSKWLAELVKTAESDPRVGIATSKILYKDNPGTIDNAGSLVMPNGWGGDRGSKQPDDGRFDREEEVFAACGASMLLRREMLDDIGLFDDSFFCYYEDIDLSWRARIRGWKVVYNYRSFLYHVHSGTSVLWSSFFTFHVLRNRHFMLLKNAWWGLFLRSFRDYLRHTIYDSIIHGGRMRQTERNKTFYDAGIRLRVFASLLKALPSLLVKRHRIRSRMSVDEECIKDWILRGGAGAC